MTIRIVCRACLGVLVGCILAISAQARELTFEERRSGQEALDRVRYRHAGAVTRPFEDVVSPSAIAERVMDTLQRSEALEQYWNRPITAEMLDREIERMASQSAMPDRLAEMFSALGNDGFLIREVLARPILVDRLTRNFFSGDEQIHGDARRRAEALRADVAAGRIFVDDDHPARVVVERRSAKISGTAHREPAAPSPGRIASMADRALQVSSLEESETSFRFEVIVDTTSEGSRIAEYEIAKIDWDSWWSTHRAEFDGSRVRAVASSAAGLPNLDQRSVSASDCAITDRHCASEPRWDTSAFGDVPDPRAGHSTIWTGSEMIVWGGNAGGSYSSGGRYDPATDTWRSLSQVGAPQGRQGQLAVWTGDVMLAIGGSSAFEGRIYEPLDDVWKPISSSGAPPVGAYSGVWAGRELIVWSYAGGTYVGGRYDPSSDTWRPVSTAGAPAAVASRSVVWTGNEVIVWGGIQPSGATNIGGRYSPDRDEWRPVSLEGAPFPRYSHSAIWSGTEMVIWGGFTTFPPTDPGEWPCSQSGGRYNPQTDTWRPTSVAGAPGGRRSPAVWTGDKVAVWGGDCLGFDYMRDGAFYDPQLDTWTAMSTQGAPSARSHVSPVWTGDALIVWGGYTDFSVFTGDYFDTGGRYDPKTDSWTPTATSPAPLGRENHTAVWTGSEVLVWGGNRLAGGGVPVALQTGGRFDPVTANWSPISVAGAPEARYLHSSVWTGERMIVWGGTRRFQGPQISLQNGGLYDPIEDRWEALSLENAPSGRHGHSSVWTGERMIVWGGATLVSGDQTYLASGGVYDPATNGWTSTTMAGAPPLRWKAAATWSGSEMFVWGGFNETQALRSGGRYNPASNTWEGVPISIQAPIGGTAAFWTGEEVLVWSGAPDWGGRFNPTTNEWRRLPFMVGELPQAGPAASTGGSLLVWDGGVGRTYDLKRHEWVAWPTENAPAWRREHSMVWMGRYLFTWGGKRGESAFLRSGGIFFPGVEPANETARPRPVREPVIRGQVFPTILQRAETMAR